MPDRFNGTSRIDHPLTGMGVGVKRSWTRYADFSEDDVKRVDCYDSSDERYAKAIEHESYSYSGEGRGYGKRITYTSHSGVLENVSSLSVTDSLTLCNQEHFDTKLIYHSYQETTHDECMAQQVDEGACLGASGMVPSTRVGCTGVFYPSRSYTWQPDDYNLQYDVSEEHCSVGGDAWGQTQPLLFGAQGRNLNVFSDHEMTFYWKNKVGGETHVVNRTDLHSMQEWCRGTITCAGLQLDGGVIYPVEAVLAPQNDTAHGYRSCDERLHRPIESAMQCFLHAASATGPEGLIYISGDEFRNFTWGYEGSETGTACYEDAAVFKWTNTQVGTRLCSDEPSDYEFLPFEQSRWQRDNDSITSTKEDDCTLHKLDWKAHNRVYKTVGTSSRPHFVLRGQKSWQREPVDCLYATDATFAINKSTARECRDEAILWSATGYSFQDVGAEFLYLTPRHFTHVEEAREECKRLHAHRDGPENTWDLCTHAQYEYCAADDSCITANTPDDSIFAKAACCFNTGTSCAITTDTRTCTPKNGYESFSFRACADEQIENTTNTTYNVYDPVWTRPEWRDETRSREYDQAYYDIVEQATRCDRRSHLSYEECIDVFFTTFSSMAIPDPKMWLGEVYDKNKIAGCAVEGTDMYYNAYRYDSAKQLEAGDKAICRRHFEHFMETFNYSNTNCRYLNHELEIDKASLLECQNYADQTDYTAFSFSEGRCLLAKDRGPCKEDALWDSRFFVSPEAVEQFQPNTNKEFSVVPVLECAENVTAAPRVLQVPWGPEAYGVAWQLPVNATSYASEAEAKAACLSDCPAIYKDPSGSYWALDRLESGLEMEPTDPSYALHRYRLRNVDNFDNRRLVTVFPSASKEDCHAECLLETSCRMVQYAYGQCMFFESIYETLATDKLSYVLYEEIKGAVSYGPSGDCWLYKNKPGQRFSDASDGDCRSILTTGSGYKTFPVDQRLAGENKVVYILTEPDLTQAALASNIVHEERSKEWCDERDGQGTWTAYPAVVSEKEHDDCNGTWTRNAAIERQNVLQRECELPDSKAFSWTRNSDAVTETKGKGGYALNYQNGYALRLGVGCGTLDLEETDKVYGQACLNATLCSKADRGHGYAVIDGACFSYLHEAGGNTSDCRWERSIANASSFLPLVRSNFADSVEACNARATCEGICERAASGRAFVLATSSVPATPTCHTGWTGDDCTTLLPSYNTDNSITDKRHSAIDYCERQGQRLCPKQTPFPMGNLLIQIAPQSACVHYEAQTECAIEDYSAIEAVASCCGRTEKSGKMLVEAVVYDRVRDIGLCSYPKGLSGSMVVDSTTKLFDTYSVQHVAKALCAGGNATTGDCEAACLAESSCNYFSNTSATCTLHNACTQLTDHFDDTAATFRLRRKAGLFDKPQEQHELIGDCKYRATVRAAAVIEQVPFEEATDELVPWRCERGSVVLDRSISFLRHSLNESFKFDVMEEHFIDDNTSISLSYEAVRYTDSVHDTLEGCLDSNEGLVNAYDSVSKRCRTFHDPASVLRTGAAFLGQSFRSAGLFEKFRMATDEPFEVLQSSTAALPVADWSLSSAADDCEVLCLQNNCDGYVLSGQDCKLVSMPNSTMLAYMRSVEATGSVIVRLRTASEFVCRPNASAWQITQFEAASMPSLALTELLGTASTLQYCKQLFFGDKRTPRLDVFLYDSSTGECRVSLLRDTLVASEGASTVEGFSAYRIAVAAMNPRRTEATKYETEDIARETCLPPDGVLAGRDCLSHECAPFWFREEDVIRHEITRDVCNPTLPPELPLLSFAWDRNRQGTLTFNVEEDTCQESQKFLSWRTGTEGRERIVVESEAECLNKSTANLTAVFLGNEPLPDHRSACNGIVDDHSFERLFPYAIQMAHSESTRIVSTQASIDECAAHANAYYAHQNRSTESKVFEYNFVDAQCAIFSEIECPTLCLPDETAKQGFFAFRLHGETGLTAASCWLLSVLDSQSTGKAYCRQCPLGKHSARAGSNCLPCQQGRYADEQGLSACKSCPEGTFQFGSGETHCHNCPAGSYQDVGEGKRSCKLCAAGKYEQNNTCHDCPAGTAAPNNFESNNAGDLVYSGANYKGPLLYYDPRFDYSDVHGISYKEADGTYMKGYSPIFTALRKLQMDQHDSAADCISCTAGTYADQSGASECKACAEGQFNTAVGATGCTECNIGEVARPSDASFHELMPFACFSAEELGEYKSYNSATDAYDKTGEDIGLIREEAQAHLEDCFESCKAEQACLFVSYKASVCRLHRKCDERGETGWAAYRMSRSTSSISDSTAYALSVEATVYGPSHHECEEESLLVAPDTYVHFPDHGITAEGTIATAFTFQDAIDQCNSRRDCVGFAYAGAEDVSLRTFEENAPILLKNHGNKFGQTGLQAWFKEQPVEKKEDCQQQCAQLTNCSFMEWNSTKICRKWSSCTPVKKASLEAPESSLYQIGLSASHRLFPFQGRWPCDAVVFGGKTKEECEAEAVGKTAPMFYFDDGACHVYVSYTSNGIDDLYSGLAGRQSSICLSGSAPPPFDESATGFLYALGKRAWDKAAVQCSFCPAGLHTEVVAATVCRQCQAGTYDKNPQSSNPCEACELGRFQDEPGQATCKACSAGRYQDETGGELCKASGQGYRAFGLGITIEGVQDTALWAKTSGPLQTNTHAQAATVDFEGATGRKICGRNSFAAGYENVACLQTPIGSISVSRQRTWTKEGQNCFFETDTSLFHGSISASLLFYEGDLFNRRGLGNLDDCIDFVNERSTERLADVVAVSFGDDHCHFYSETADAAAPKCILNDLYESAQLSVSEAQYGSQNDAPAIDPEWSRKWTPHENVRFVSPYQCTGINYEYIGDYLSVGDCINACRHASHASSPFFKAACRYISYNSDDNKCYLVNWEKTLQPDPTNDASGSSDKIYENTITNIDMPCTFGSRSISHNDQDGIGSGGYRVHDYVPAAEVGNYTEFEVNDDDSFGDTMKIEGQYSASREKSLGNGGFASLRSGSEDAELPLGKTLVTHDLNEVRKITSIRLWVGNGVHKTEHGYQYAILPSEISDSNARYPARFWPKTFKINDVPYTVNLEPWDLHAAWINANGYGDIELDLDEPLYTHQLSVEITEWGAAYVAVERHPNWWYDPPKVRSRCKADNSLFPDNGFGANPSTPADCSHEYYHDFISVNIADVEKVDYYDNYDRNPCCTDTTPIYTNEATLKLTFEAVDASDSEWSIPECASMAQQTRSGGVWQLMTSFLATRGDGSKHLMTFDNTYSIGGTTYPESVRNMWQYSGGTSLQVCQQICLQNGHKYVTHSGYNCNCANSINPYQLRLEQEEWSAGRNGDPTRDGDESLYHQNQELGFYISYPCLNPSYCTLPPPVRGIYEIVGSDENQAGCRWTRKRYYDRLTTAILQDHTLASNVFPNYKEAEGYSGPNLLQVLGFYEIWDLNDITPGIYSTHQSFLTKKANRGSGKFSFVYKRVNHIAYNHSSIVPLFDVGTNADNFETLDSTMTQYRAKEGANSFEYCSGSTMQPSAAYSPNSCDDLGYPFVIDQFESVSSSRKICVKVGSQPIVKCCIGEDCGQQSYPMCTNAAVSFLPAVPYAQSQYLAIDATDENVLLEHTNTDETAGLAHIKDRCSEMGDICIGVSTAVSSEFYYAHGDEALLKIKASNDKPFFFKTANFVEHGLGSIEGSETEDGIDNIQDCYARCIQIRFCLMFSFETGSQTCRLQRNLLSSVASSSTSVVFFIHKNTEDNSKAQFCLPCAVGRTASDANQGGTGNCQKCAPGEISSTDDLYVVDEHVGLAGQEQCQACPAGMMFLGVTASCIACPKGFACAKESSFFKVGVEQCRRNEYSTTSLLDFNGEDVSSTASLRCTYCGGGKYSNMPGSEYCEKCPKGYYSEKLTSCLPCKIGTYSFMAGSEECISVDAQSFVAWPAATLSMKRLCSTADCTPPAAATDRRICTRTHDAYCQACPEIKPGHKTVGTSCTVTKCEKGTYSPNGCFGENCCLPCVSTCKAGQYSVGCGGPDDDGGSTENTKCQDCPVDSYTQYDAIGASCDEANFAHPLFCAKCSEAPHVFADSNQPFSTSSPFTHLGVTHPQTHISHERCAAGSDNTGSPENSFPQLERADRCCSAAAYKCIPCRNSEKVTYRYSYNLNGRTERWGKSNQPAWSTDGETGATHCKSYWNLWNFATRDAIVKWDKRNAPKKGGGGGGS